MPGYDRTGPLGRGSRTGGGLGFCRGGLQSGNSRSDAVLGAAGLGRRNRTGGGPGNWVNWSEPAYGQGRQERRCQTRRGGGGGRRGGRQGLSRTRQGG